MTPSHPEIVQMVRTKMERHKDLDWTCAVQAVAMEIARDEQELLEDLRDTFKGEQP